MIQILVPGIFYQEGMSSLRNCLRRSCSSWLSRNFCWWVDAQWRNTMHSGGVKGGQRAETIFFFKFNFFLSCRQAWISSHTTLWASDSAGQGRSPGGGRWHSSWDIKDLIPWELKEEFQIEGTAGVSSLSSSVWVTEGRLTWLEAGEWGTKTPMLMLKKMERLDRAAPEWPWGGG